MHFRRPVCRMSEFVYVYIMKSCMICRVVEGRYTPMEGVRYVVLYGKISRRTRTHTHKKVQRHIHSRTGNTSYNVKSRVVCRV